MRRACIILAIIGTLAAPADAAPSDAEMRQCAALADMDERLACFDTLAARSEPTPSPGALDFTGDITAGAWLIRKSRSRIDDSPQVLARTEAVEEVTVGYLARPERPTLWIRCVEDTTALGITFERTMMTDMDGGGEVTFRLDDDSAFARSLRESSNNRSLGLWSGTEAIPLIKSMQGKRTLLARVRPYNEAPLLLEFDLTGIDEALIPVRNACGW